MCWPANNVYLKNKFCQIKANSCNVNFKLHSRLTGSGLAYLS